MNEKGFQDGSTIVFNLKNRPGVYYHRSSCSNSEHYSALLELKSDRNVEIFDIYEGWENSDALAYIENANKEVIYRD